MVKKMLNIAMFGHKRIPSREGGIEIVVEELAVRMVLRGHRVTCFNRKGHHVSGEEYDTTALSEYKGIRIRDVWTIEKRGVAAVSSSFFAAVKAAFGKYDIVHIHAEGPAAMSWLPHLMRKKVIVTIHGLDWARQKWGGFASAYIKWGEKQAVKYADQIIVLSNNLKEYFEKEYGRETVYIPNAISRPVIREADQIKALWELDKNGYVLFVGRLVPEKGLEYLLKAWNSIETDKKLVITGGTSDTDEFTLRLKSLQKDNVIFTGFQEGRTLEELYSNAYIYCLPSDLEGMPLSLLEALSYGNCCLVSNIEECTEVVEDKAVTFEKSNIEDLKAKLSGLLESEETVNHYKDLAADFVCSKYNWDDVVSRTLQVYEGN